MEEYKVWAIKYLDYLKDKYTVKVSAESEYGAVKRLVSNRQAQILAVELTDLKPEYSERRIEGYFDYKFKEKSEHWEYV
jgi:hypothetical protein